MRIFMAGNGLDRLLALPQDRPLCNISINWGLGRIAEILRQVSSCTAVGT